MTLSSKVCLMKLGVLQQYSPPLELYGSPQNIFCADFMGNPSMNFVPCKGTPRDGAIELEAESFSLLFHPNSPAEIRSGQELVLGIRPEAVKIVPSGGIESKVISSLPTGLDTILSLNARGTILSAIDFGIVDYKMDSIIRFTFEGNRFVLFDKESTNQITLGSLSLRA